MNHKLLKLLPFAFLACLPCFGGCSTSLLNSSLSFKSKIEQESSTNPVVQIIPVWTEGEGPGVDDRGITRGFQGQLYFITDNKGLPSQVDGGIRVYLFDDAGTEEEQQKPIYQFDFEPEAWKYHLISTKLGPAYSVFIPYTRPGRHLAHCALRIRYTPTAGAPVFSEMATLTLPGPKRTDASTASQTKFTEPSAQTSKMKSTTIDLSGKPKRFAEQEFDVAAQEEVPNGRSNSAVRQVGYEQTNELDPLDQLDAPAIDTRRTRKQVAQPQPSQGFDPDNPFGVEEAPKAVFKTYSVPVE